MVAQNGATFGRQAASKLAAADSNNEDSVTRINNVVDSAEFADRRINSRLVGGDSVTA